MNPSDREGEWTMSSSVRHPVTIMLLFSLLGAGGSGCEGGFFKPYSQLDDAELEDEFD